MKIVLAVVAVCVIAGVAILVALAFADTRDETYDRATLDSMTKKGPQ